MPDTTLRMWISGLCLLVHDSDKGKVHVVTPATGKGMMNGKAHVHQHTAQWLVDLGYFGGGRLTDFFVRVPFDGRIMDLSNILTTPQPTISVNYVPNITTILGHNVIRTPLNGKLPPEASSRLTLAHGSVTDRASGPCYKLDKTKTEMPNAVEWTIDKIAWPPNVTDETGMLGRLTPINDEIVLYLYNVPAEEFPVSPNSPPTSNCKPNIPPHYIAYYSLVFNGATEGRLPIFQSSDPCSGARGSQLGPSRGVNPFTCMLAAGDA